MRNIVILLCLVCSAHTELGLERDKILNYDDNGEDFGMPQLNRNRRGAESTANESPIKIGPAADQAIAGLTHVASKVPAYVKDGRHYWPANVSLSHQIGLEGVKSLVDEVTSYERTRALAVARRASCEQRNECYQKHGFARMAYFLGFGNQVVDCDQLYAGCRHYH